MPAVRIPPTTLTPPLTAAGPRPWPASGSSRSSSTAPGRSGRCTWPTSARTSSRSRTPGSGGDVSRYIPPGRVGTDSLFFEAFNRGKRSLALDLKTSGGRAVFERLVASADAVFSNLRGDQAARLGLTYDTLGRINPAIVCVALTGYGREGSGARLPGYDALIQAETGWASLTGAPDGPPTKSGLSLADYIAGLTAALGLVVALLDARQTGRGRDVDTNLYDSALAMLSYPATWFLSSGFVTRRHEMSGAPERRAVPVLRHLRRPRRRGQSQGEVLPDAGRGDGPR